MSKSNGANMFMEPYKFAEALIQAAMDARRPPIYGTYVRRARENKVIAYTTTKPDRLVWNVAKAMQDGRDRRTDWVLFVRNAPVTDPIREVLKRAGLGCDGSENAIYQMVLCVPGTGWSVTTVPAAEFTTEDGELRASYTDQAILMVESLLTKVDHQIIIASGEMDYFRADLAEIKKVTAYYETIPQRETREGYLDLLRLSETENPEAVAALDTIVDALIDRTMEHRLSLDAETPADFIESLLEAIPDSYGYSADDRIEAIEGAIEAEIEEEGAREGMLAEFEEGRAFKDHVLLLGRAAGTLAVRAMEDKGAHPRRVALLTAASVSGGDIIQTTLFTMFELPEDDDAQAVALRLVMGGASQELLGNASETTNHLAVAVSILSTFNGRVTLAQLRDEKTNYAEEDIIIAPRKSGNDVQGELAPDLSRGRAERLLLDMTIGKGLLAQAQFAYEGRWSRFMTTDSWQKPVAPKTFKKLMREAAQEAILAGWTIPMVAATAHVETAQ